MDEYVITKVYEYYDGPKLFLVIDESNKPFLGYWYDLVNYRDVYLMVPLTTEIVNKMENREICIREVILNPVDNYTLEHFGAAGDHLITTMKKGDIDPTSICDSDWFIEYIDEV